MAEKHFLQTKAWAKVRSRQGHIAHELEDCYMLEKPTPRIFKNFGVISQVDTSILNWDILLQKAVERKLSHVHIDPIDLEKNLNLSSLERQHGVKLNKADELLLRATVIINLQQSEDELLAAMKRTTRYNCLYALKKGIEVEVRDDSEAIEVFISLFFQAVKRQGFLGRSPEYYRQVWQILREEGRAVIAVASYAGEPLVAHFLFLGDEAVYNTYTGSSRNHHKLKPTYAALWEVVRWGKRNGYKYINLWGIKPDAEPSDPEYGFSKFKQSFGGEVVPYAESFDVVIDPLAYRIFKFMNWLRMSFLRLRKLF